LFKMLIHSGTNCSETQKGSSKALFVDRAKRQHNCQYCVYARYSIL